MNLGSTINRNYVLQNQTAMVVWNLIYSWYSILPFAKQVLYKKQTASWHPKTRAGYRRAPQNGIGGGGTPSAPPHPISAPSKPVASYPRAICADVCGLYWSRFQQAYSRHCWWRRSRVDVCD